MIDAQQEILLTTSGKVTDPRTELSSNQLHSNRIVFEGMKVREQSDLYCCSTLTATAVAHVITQRCDVVEACERTVSLTKTGRTHKNVCCTAFMCRRSCAESGYTTHIYSISVFISLSVPRRAFLYCCYSSNSNIPYKIKTGVLDVCRCYAQI